MPKHTVRLSKRQQSAEERIQHGEWYSFMTGGWIDIATIPDSHLAQLCTHWFNYERQQLQHKIARAEHSIHIGSADRSTRAKNARRVALVAMNDYIINQEVKTRQKGK